MFYPQMTQMTQMGYWRRREAANHQMRVGRIAPSAQPSGTICVICG
jgi:hypothetical protein